MISMDEFKCILKYRSEGKTQQQIADKMGLSRKTIGRYLKEGKIPEYNREKPTKVDPLDGFYQIVEELITQAPNLTVAELYDIIVDKGYLGSQRTLSRKTSQIRAKIKRKNVYFQRAKTPGEVMEGDFTELHVRIGGTLRRVHLWVTTLVYSGRVFATPFYQQTFECFAEGSVLAFKNFGGVAKRYRLDNLSPAVAKILSGKERMVTKRYAEFQRHYDFYQDFCNPGAGNEKGSVESQNKHLKRRIYNLIKVNKLEFKDLNSLKKLIWDLCEKLNDRIEVRNKFLQEELKKLPPHVFDCFKTTVVKVNKYCLVTVDESGHWYSVPSYYMGLNIEARIFSEEIEFFYQGEKIASHSRLYGPKGQTSINIRHVISSLLRKPSAFKDWKHREILFENKVWKKFYEVLHKNNPVTCDIEYLRCISFIQQFPKEVLTVAMELALENPTTVSRKELKDLLTNQCQNIVSIKPIRIDLQKYDRLLTRS